MSFNKVDSLSEKVSPAEPENLDKPGYLGVSPPSGQLPQKGERQWIDRPEQLLRALNTLQQANVVAIDAEFAQARSRAQADVLNTSPRLALLQLAIDGHCFV